jgi:hypothetical protein
MALIPENDAGGAQRSEQTAYLLLLALEASGAGIIIWHGLPLYRSLLSVAGYQQADGGIIIWAIGAVVLIQASYWVSTFKVFPALSVRRHVFAGHAVLFLARLNFVFVSSLFAVVVFSRPVDLEFVAWRAATLLAVLFSMFCFTLELERLGKRLRGE